MDPSGAVEHQPIGLRPSQSSQPRATAKVAHRVSSGASLHLGPNGERHYTVSCSCGWVSETCGTAVLAEADGEQHLTLARKRRAPRTEPR